MATVEKDLIEQFLEKYPLKNYGTEPPFKWNNWTGLITPNYFSETGSYLTFSPVPEEISPIAGLLLVGFFKKLMDTDAGRKQLTDIIQTYLKTISTVLTELHKTSISNPYICLFNNYLAVNIYKRLGLMSPLDSLQCRAWLDHQVGEALLSDRAEVFGTALTTLVQGATIQEKSGDTRGEYESSSARGLMALLGSLAK